eukprot:scaffold1473_cov375-Prasinococcus_capsulatus_cf.AAC.11
MRSKDSFTTSSSKVVLYGGAIGPNYSHVPGSVACLRWSPLCWWRRRMCRQSEKPGAGVAARRQ